MHIYKHDYIYNHDRRTTNMAQLIWRSEFLYLKITNPKIKQVYNQII